MRFRWIILVAVVLILIFGGFRVYRSIEIFQGKTAYSQQKYTVAVHKLSPFSGGDPEAEAMLADMYEKGLGTSENDQAAFDLMTKSANSGFVYAEDLLGAMYQEGTGTSINYSQSAYWYQKAAEQGNLDAQVQTGEHYLAGQGVPQDYGQAINWLQKASDQGSADAEDDLGKLYSTGKGETQDYTQAAALFQKSADQGNADAQANLGICYHNGSGVPQDDTKAVALFQPAAQAGNATAQYYLGLAYQNGNGIDADQSQALSFFQQAAMQGNPDAQEALGQIYANGSGQGPASQDVVLAYALFNLAAGQGNVDAQNSKTALSNNLTPEQLADGQSLASQWSVNSELPATSFEDKAPQVLFTPGSTTPDIYQASKTWFSRSFNLGGQSWYVVFEVTQGTQCHACSAEISAATFRLDPSSGDYAEIYGEPNFTQFGTYGDAPVDDPKAPPTSDSRIATKLYNFGGNNIAILIPYSDGGMGEYDWDDEIFSFRLKNPNDVDSGQWTDVGRIETGYENTTGDTSTGDCSVDSKPTDGSGPITCNSWKGSISIIPVAGSDWPEIQVNEKGTVLDANQHPIPAPNQVYQYNGQKYAPLNQ